MVDGLNYAIFSDMMTLTPLNVEPDSPVSGMIVVADGVSWDPGLTGVDTLVVYLNGAWRQVAAGV
jgi:hypothetical protein